MPANPTDPRDLTSTKAMPILARSLFRQMRDQGYSRDQIIGFSTELITLVSEHLQQEQHEHLAAE